MQIIATSRKTAESADAVLIQHESKYYELWWREPFNDVQSECGVAIFVGTRLVRSGPMLTLDDFAVTHFIPFPSGSTATVFWELDHISFLVRQLL